MSEKVFQDEEWEDDCLKVGIFSALEPELRREFAERGKLSRLTVGSFVTKQGSSHTSMSVVLRGSVSVSCHAHGDIVHLADVEEGGLVGEISLVDRLHCSADVVVTKKDTVLWSISYAAFDHFVETEPASAIKVYRIIAGELCRLLRCNSELMLHREDSMRSRFLDMDY